MTFSIDWIGKLRNMLQVIAFTLAVATIQYAFSPERPYGIPVAYSVLIGLFTWVVIDFGRHLFPSAQETGWPSGKGWIGLVIAGIAVGYFAGTTLGDRICMAFGWYLIGPPVDPATVLRNSVLITVLAGATGSYYFYTHGKSAYLERKMTEARQQANEARLKLLETQLEPHMLFNTLANLRVLIGIDPPAAQQMLDRINDYLRATLQASRATHHPLQAEFDRLRDYLELMSVRMGPRLHYTLDLPDALARASVPTLLLQPLVENAIKHGLEPKVEGGEIMVSAREVAGLLELEVSDSGIGPGQSAADRPQGTAATGFGMDQVRQRLTAAYDGAASFDWSERAGGGMHCRLRLPLSHEQ